MWWSSHISLQGRGQSEVTYILFAWDSLTSPLPSYLALIACLPSLRVWVWMTSYRVIVD